MLLTLLRGPTCCNLEKGSAFGFHTHGLSRGHLYTSHSLQVIKYNSVSLKSCPERDQVGHFELEESELKEVVQEGINMKDVIKLGRRGVCPSAVEHIRRRWNTSRVRFPLFWSVTNLSCVCKLDL